MSKKVFTSTLELAQAVTDWLTSEIEGNPHMCYCCLANELIEDHKSALIQDLHTASKDAPQVAMSAISYALIKVETATTLLEEMMESMNNLYPEIFEEEAEEVTAPFNR